MAHLADTAVGKLLTDINKLLHMVYMWSVNVTIARISRQSGLGVLYKQRLIST